MTMFYHLDIDIDFGSMGAQRDSIIEAEIERAKQLVAEGVVVAEWLKANGLGVVAVWDCRDHAHLRDLLGSLPMTPYFKRIDITPCVGHPLFPTGRPAK